jgi:hypothetical protein
MLYISHVKKAIRPISVAYSTFHMWKNIPNQNWELKYPTNQKTRNYTRMASRQRENCCFCKFLKWRKYYLKWRAALYQLIMNARTSHWLSMKYPLFIIWPYGPARSLISVCFYFLPRLVAFLYFNHWKSLYSVHLFSNVLKCAKLFVGSYDKMLIDWVRSPWPRAKYFPCCPPTQSIST